MSPLYFLANRPPVIRDYGQRQGVVEVKQISEIELVFLEEADEIG